MSAAQEDALWREVGILEGQVDELRERLASAEAATQRQFFRLVVVAAVVSYLIVLLQPRAEERHEPEPAGFLAACGWRS